MNKIKKRKMKLSFAKLLIATGLVGTAVAYSSSSSDRRAFLNKGGQVATGVAAVVAAGAAAPKPVFADEDPYADYEVTESGLKYKITKEGNGAQPAVGQMVKAHYTGWLDEFNSIKKFDSSRDRGRPFSFKVGAGQVIRGWDESFLSMKVGERRNIIIPPRLGTFHFIL